MKRRRRHHPIGSNRPEAPAAYVIAAISAVSVMAYFFCMYVSFRSGGNTANWIGGMGVLFIFAGALCLAAGVPVFKNADFAMRSRLIALLTPLVSLVLWLHLYIVGMLYG
ncbi:MAG: hypothetical protein IJT32_02370 [Lachnospiraceae bacterium]|nr:hypothetical protein [Lachnospiraceae bacterium]